MKKVRPTDSDGQKDVPQPNKGTERPSADDSLIDSYFKEIYKDDTVFKSISDAPASARVHKPTAKYTIKYNKKFFQYQDDSDITLSKKNIPKLIIPKKKPRQGSSTEKSPALEKLTQVPVSPDPNPIVSRDLLRNFDDEAYDDDDFYEKIQKRLPLPGHSVYYTQNGNCEWRSCSVIAYSDGLFTIKWVMTGRTKQVPRISLLFDDEDHQRFNERRARAEKARLETDASMRQEMYLVKRSEHTNVTIEPEIITDLMKKLSEEDQKNHLVVGLLQEMQEQYIYAHALVGYAEDWEDPEISKKFEQANLPHFCLRKLPKIHIQRIQIPDFDLPNFQSMMKMFQALYEYEEDDFLKETMNLLEKPILIKEFFNRLQFQTETTAAYCSSILYKLLHTETASMIAKKSPERQKSLLLMINLRYKALLGHIVRTALDKIKSHVLFSITFHNDLITSDQTKEELLKIGSEAITFISQIFVKNQVILVDPFAIDDTPLILDSVGIDEIKKSVEEYWKNMIEDSFEDFNKRFSVLKQLTSNIPRDPIAECTKILPSDFMDVIENGSPIKSLIIDIDLDSVRKLLNNAIDDYYKYQLVSTNTFETNNFIIDISDFNSFLQKQYDLLFSTMFKYLSAHTDCKISVCFDLITSLETRSSKISDDVEDWHEKHCLLIKLQTNVESLAKDLDSARIVLGFLSEYQYEPKLAFTDAYNVKHRLFNVSTSLPKYQQLDSNERSRFIQEHLKAKSDFSIELSNFQKELHAFLEIPVTQDSEKTTNELLEMQKQYEVFCQTRKLYYSRDEKLEIEKTEYPVMDSILDDFNLLLPVWEISKSLDTTCQKWLATVFRELKVKEMTSLMVEWEATLKNTVEKLGDQHFLTPSVKELLDRTSQLILHLPIVRCLCNNNLRSRHWARITQIIKYQLGPNDGITWHWLIESGIEENLIAIASISRAADMEFKIEKALGEMIEDMQKLRFKVEEEEGIMKIKDPSEVVVLLGNHQQKMQEIFVPPYIQPFIGKIKDYEVLASNIRQILKQTLETQTNIESLRPAIDSSDLRNQHADMCESFDDQVKQFNEFTGNFKLQLSFHQIVSNQRFVDLSKELFVKFDILRQELSEVLEEKRKAFPRFRLLSDSQLVSILSNSQTPSKVNNIWSIMYPAIAEAKIVEEKYCIGFISTDNEEFVFEHQIPITPEAIEKWFNDFDVQIGESLRTITQRLVRKTISNIDKIARTYPAQIVTLVFEIMLTQNMSMIFSSFDSSFADNRAVSLNEQMQQFLLSTASDLQTLIEAYKKAKTPGIPSMIVTKMNHRDLIQKLIDRHVDNSSSPEWVAKLKYFMKEDGQIDVLIGPTKRQYGFEFTGSKISNIETEETAKLFNSLILSLSTGISPLVCSDSFTNKEYLIISFANALGKQVISYPCFSYFNINHLRHSIKNAIDCHSFAIFKKINNLNPYVLNQLSLEFLKNKEDIPSSVAFFFTYNVDGSPLPEYMRFAFRPITVTQADAKTRFRMILTAHGIFKSQNEIVDSLYKISTEYAPKAKPPLNSILSTDSFINMITSSSFSDENCIEEIYNFVIEKLTNELSGDNVLEAIEIIDKQFNRACMKRENSEETQLNSNVNKKLEEFLCALKYHPGLIIVGQSLSGKTSLIKEAIKIEDAKAEYINPLAMNIPDILGNGVPGLLSTLTESEWFIFDGTICPSWFDSIALSLESPRCFYFGDESKFMLQKTQKLIFETDQILDITPASLSRCSIIYLGETYLTFEDHLSMFLKIITSDGRLVEGLSNTIVGSTLSTDLLTDSISKISRKFIPELMSIFPDDAPIHLNQCSKNYFDFLRASILSYYVGDIISSRKESHQSAESLIADIPNLAIFSIYWSFAGIFVDDKRIQMERKIKSLLDKPFENELSEIYFDYSSHKWVKWDNLEKSDFFSQDFQSKMIDLSPHYLLISQQTLLPSLFITNSLLSQNMNIMLYGTHELTLSGITNLTMNTPFVLENFSPNSYLYGENKDHNYLNEIVFSLLPDPVLCHSFSIRKPLLALKNFDGEYMSSSSELMRYIIEHDYFFNDTTLLKSVVNGIKFVISCKEGKINHRLLSHMFMIHVSAPTEDLLVQSITTAISQLWNIKNNVKEISRSLLSMFREISNNFKFNIKHLFMVLQRVAIVQHHRSESLLADAIAHESVRVFYDATHQEDILAKINIALRDIAKLSNTTYVSAFEIADKIQLSNINSFIFRSVGNLKDCQQPGILPGGQESHLPLNKFTTSSSAIITLNEPYHISQTSRSMQFDVISLSRSLSLPRTHTVIFSPLTKVPYNIVTRSCDLISSNLHIMKRSESFLKCFHNGFIEAGKTKKHYVLFIDTNILFPEEEKLLEKCLSSFNIYGLFEKGEKIRIMTDLYSHGSVNTFDDDSLETNHDYNKLLLDFLTDCETYFHFCVVQPKKPDECNLVENVHVYSPYFDEVQYISKIIKKIHTKLDLETIMEKIRNIELLKRYPYLTCSTNFEHILTRFEIQNKEKTEQNNAKKDKLEKLDALGILMKSFLEDLYKKTTLMENELIKVTQELEMAFSQIETLSQIAQQETAKFSAENDILKQEEAKANALKKECDNQMKETKEILESATREVKALSSRDTAVIKAMNHPPHGVVLVVKTMLIILNQPFDVNNEDTMWVAGKKMMSDVSFLSKIINSALDSLKPNQLQQLSAIIADPNFEPEVIQRSSSAAKSICNFIRSIVPYYEALDIYKQKMKEVQLMESDLEALRSKYEKSMQELAKSKQKFLEMQNRQQELLRKKQVTEDQLFDMSQKIDTYKKVDDSIKPYFQQIGVNYKMLLKEIENCEAKTLLNQLMSELSGPFNAEERKELYDSFLKIIGVQFTRQSILSTEDALTKKWEILRYPVSLFWKENTSYLSSISNRWVVVSGLHKCADSYIKKVIDRQQISYISVLSSDFENSFIFSISRNQGVVLFDFDFDNPNELVLLVHEAHMNDMPITFKGQTFNVPPKFIVYFDVEQLPRTSSIRMNVRFLSMNVDDQVNTEMMSMRLFELTNEKQANETRTIEIQYTTLLAEIEHIDESIKIVLSDSNTKIYDDKNQQWEFLNLTIKMKDSQKSLSKLKQMHLWLFDDFPTLNLMAKSMLEFFEFFPNKEIIWKLFEDQFDTARHLPTDTLLDYVKLKLFNLMAAQLPFVDRMRICAKTYDLRLDGGNSFIQGKGMTLSRSDESFIVSPLTPPEVSHCNSHDNLPLCEKIEADEGFDRLFTALCEMSDDTMQLYQDPYYIFKHTSSRRPIIIYSPESVFAMVTLMHTCSVHAEKFVIWNQDSDYVKQAAQSGIVLLTFCSSIEQLNNAKSAISSLFSSGFVSETFRLFICVNTELDFSSIFTKCDIIHADIPFTVKSFFTANIDTQINKKTDSFISHLALFDAAVNTLINLQHNSGLFSPHNFKISSLCKGIDNKDIVEYLDRYFYSTDRDQQTLGIWKKCKTSSVQTTYVLPKLFNEQSITKSIYSFPYTDDPLVWGLEEHAFIAFKGRLRNIYMDSE